ncbi:ATP-binding protein [Yoonia sp.]|uniref:PAS domain S-box protein n=1 Tax=Yoonia sp. TaxID=2212373 RepID=UPI0039761F0D
MLDAMPDAVLFSDKAGIITRTNAAVDKLFGYDSAELIGSSVNMLMPQALSSRHDRFIENYLKTGSGRIIGRGRAVEGVRRNGDAFPLHVSLGHITHDGEDHFVAIMHDFSARVAAEAALSRTARLDAIGQMTAGIGHNFNNILTVVIGNLELLEAQLSNPAQHAMLADAREAATIGMDLTAGLGAFGRKSNARCDVIDINAACSAALELIKHTFDPQYVILMELTDNLPAALADSTHLQSALINIALNARDAMPDGGTLITRSEVVTVDDHYIAQELDIEEGTYVRISVTDTGCGMGPDTQQHVFEPFFTTKPVGQGTGLGLATVYGFVRQCGGHVTIYSEIGHGTTVALYFPAIDEIPTEKPLHNKRESREAAGQRTILIVEDNPRVRSVTSDRLRDLGYDVRVAGQGDHAARMLRENADVHAVFTDLVMPGELDGLALARLIEATYPHIRILLTSGYAEDILSREIDDIPHQILRKPYRQSELAEALLELFDLPGSAQGVTSQVKE